MTMKSKIRLIQICLLLLILNQCWSLKVEINNIHNGYKYIFKGTPVLSIQQSSPSTLTLTNTVHEMLNSKLYLTLYQKNRV